MTPAKSRFLLQHSRKKTGLDHQGAVQHCMQKNARSWQPGREVPPPTANPPSIIPDNSPDMGQMGPTGLIRRALGALRGRSVLALEEDANPRDAFATSKFSIVFFANSPGEPFFQVWVRGLGLSALSLCFHSFSESICSSQFSEKRRHCRIDTSARMRLRRRRCMAGFSMRRLRDDGIFDPTEYRDEVVPPQRKNPLRRQRHDGRRPSPKPKARPKTEVARMRSRKQ